MPGSSVTFDPHPAFHTDIFAAEEAAEGVGQRNADVPVTHGSLVVQALGKKNICLAGGGA